MIAAAAGPSGVPGGMGSTVVWPADSLAEALLAESQTLDELLGVIRRQRAAVARDDLQAIDDSVFATHRILVTLEEARRRRRSLNQLLGQPDDLALTDLEDALGDRMTPDLRDARDTLIDIARTLSREVGINRDVLRGVIANGEALVRGLSGNGIDTSAGYTGPKGTPVKGSATMLDRRI
jgi:hypothetical protein